VEFRVSKSAFLKNRVAYFYLFIGRFIKTLNFEGVQGSISRRSKSRKMVENKVIIYLIARFCHHRVDIYVRSFVRVRFCVFWTREDLYLTSIC
jgi:hypothetical protein